MEKIDDAIIRHIARNEMIVRLDSHLDSPEGQTILAALEEWPVGYDQANDTYWCRPSGGDHQLRPMSWDSHTVRALEPLYRDEQKGRKEP